MADLKDLRGAYGPVAEAIAAVGASIQDATGRINSILLSPNVNDVLSDEQKMSWRALVAELDMVTDGIRELGTDPSTMIPVPLLPLGVEPGPQINDREGNVWADQENIKPMPGTREGGRVIPDDVPYVEPREGQIVTYPASHKRHTL